MTEENKPKSKKLPNTLITIAIAAIVVICLLINFFYTRVTNATHKQALFMIVTELSVDDSRLKFNET
ncbi:MAG: hypothetical protein V1699_05705, partial [Candidatus Omnitrophota bacterium]